MSRSFCVSRRERRVSVNSTAKGSVRGPLGAALPGAAAQAGIHGGAAAVAAVQGGRRDVSEGWEGGLPSPHGCGRGEHARADAACGVERATQDAGHSAGGHPGTTSVAQFVAAQAR